MSQPVHEAAGIVPPCLVAPDPGRCGGKAKEDPCGISARQLSGRRCLRCWSARARRVGAARAHPRRPASRPQASRPASLPASSRRPRRPGSFHDPRPRGPARMPGTAVLPQGPAGQVRPHIQGIRASRCRGSPDRGSRQGWSGPGRHAADVGPVHRGQRTRPAPGRQAAAAGRQPHPGRPQGRPGREPGYRHAPQRRDGEAHPGTADQPEQGRDRRRQVVRRRGQGMDRRAELRCDQPRPQGRHHGRIDQLLRAGGPCRDLRPATRVERCQGDPEVPAREP